VRIVRVVGVFAAAVLAVTGLSACQSKVGAAAFVGSTRISESTVGKYISSTAAPTVSDTTGALDSPRSDALGTLIQVALFNRLLKSEPAGAPTAAQLDAAGVTVLAGSSYSSLGALEDAVVVSGFTRAYGALLLDQAAKQSIVTTRLKDPGDGSVALPALVKLNVHVTTSPRYAAWDDSTLSVGAGPRVSSFLKVLSSNSIAVVNPSSG